MKKLSKNEGKTSACPACKKTLIKSANLLGQGNFRTKCPYCQSVILVEIKQESSIRTVLIKLGILSLIAVGLYQVYNLAEIKNAVMAVINQYNIDINDK